jgi:ABC-type branched-subunit amino acid transport system ATPase component
MLRFENATVAVGGVDLLEGVDWHVPPGAKVGLVGRNGTGHQLRSKGCSRATSGDPKGDDIALKALSPRLDLRQHDRTCAMTLEVPQRLDPHRSLPAGNRDF